MERIRRAFMWSSRPPIPVVLYTRPGCHLCDDARALLHRITGPGEIVLEEVDIRTDPELIRAYDLRIPVLQIEGGMELSAPIREDDLRRALRAVRRT